MGILNNFENAWDGEFQFESTPMPETDNVGRKVWTNGPAVYDALTIKLFSEAVCNNCSSK
jgi:hypothetical protein